MITATGSTGCGTWAGRPARSRSEANVRAEGHPGPGAGTLLSLLIEVLPSGCERPPPKIARGASQPATGTRASATAQVFTPDGSAPLAGLAVGPVTQFAQSCSRCHGAQGALYGPTFAALDEAALAAKVREMMEHNAQLRPTAGDLAAMVAHHRALQRRRPFVCVTNGAAYASGREAVLRGEFANAERLTVEADGEALPVTVQGAQFKIAVGSGRGVMVRAESATAAITLEFPRQQWTD